MRLITRLFICTIVFIGLSSHASYGFSGRLADSSFDNDQKTASYVKKLFADVHGFAKSEIAYRIHSPYEFTKVKNILFVSKEGEIRPGIGYMMSARAYYDAVFDLTDTYSHTVEDDQEHELELRDTYLDISIGDIDLRLGNQQIVWGEAVGLFFADVVNPKNLREFILPDFDQIRIPVWGADVEYHIGNSHIEFVWIPILEFNKLGVHGSEFEFYSPPLPARALIRYRDEKEPPDTLENSEVGIRLSRIISGWELNAFYFHSYDYFPTPFRTITTDPSTSQTIITVNPEYKRLDFFGFTFAKEVKDIVFKGEFIFNNGKYFQVKDPKDSDGVIKKDFLDYLLGVDYTFFNKIDFNVQFMQRIIFAHSSKMFNDEIETAFSIWLKTGFFNNKLEPEIFLVSSLREQDIMFRPKISYKLTDAWTLTVGADAFAGHCDKTFGQFSKRDRAYVEIKYDF